MWRSGTVLWGGVRGARAVHRSPAAASPRCSRGGPPPTARRWLSSAGSVPVPPPSASPPEEPEPQTAAPGTAEEIAQRYCELHKGQLDGDMRERLALTIKAAMSDDTATSQNYESWLESLECAASAGAVRQLVLAHERGDELALPPRPAGLQGVLKAAVGAVSIATQLKEQAQRGLSAKARQNGWKPKEERGDGSDGGDEAPTTPGGSDLTPGVGSVYEKPKLRKGFEELLPPDWAAAPGAAATETPSQEQQATDGPAAPVRQAVAVSTRAIATVI